MEYIYDKEDFASNLQRLLMHFEYNPNDPSRSLKDVEHARLMITKAFIYATVAHDEMQRKSGEPYVTHPIAVALELDKIHADYETICAALLHDTVEDVKWVTIEKLEKEFNPTIAHLVDGVTKVANLKYDDKKIQTMKTQNKLVLSLNDDVRIIIIKLYDRLHNMLTIKGHPNQEKRIEIARETMEVYVPIARHLGLFELKGRLEQLCFPILHPELNEEINNIKKGVMEKGSKEDKIKDLHQLIADLEYDGSERSLRKLFKKNNIAVDDIEFKFKGNYGIYHQLQRGKKITQINDLLTFKIKTRTIEDAYNAMRIINEFSTDVINKPDYANKDYIAHPKYAFYRALHTYNIIESNGNRYQFHFQIQTTDMWRESVDGIASKWNYDIDNSGAKRMQESLNKDFPFFDDLKRLCEEYKKGDCSEVEFREKVEHLILPRQININMSNFTQEKTYAGCTIKDFIIKLSRNGKLEKICPNQEYYVNDKKVDLLYTLQDEDTFELRVKTLPIPEIVEEKPVQRKRKK